MMPDRPILKHHRIPEELQSLTDDLLSSGFRVMTAGITAYDMVLRQSFGSVLDIATNASLIDLSQLIDDLLFPGSEYIDAAAVIGRYTVLFHLFDGDEPQHLVNPRELNFFFDLSDRSFSDPFGSFAQIRSGSGDPNPFLREEDWYGCCAAALLKARYGYDSGTYTGERPMESDIFQRLLLIRILESKDPASGMAVLRDSGFISQHWPLIGDMIDVVQDKDFHPEGDVWDHTMDMFSYLKKDDLDLRLSILLHDSGKAYADEFQKNRFDRHAQIGAHRSRRFLRALGFPEAQIEKVGFLVDNHMIASYAPGLPVFRVAEVLSSQWYPDVLELFRCDIASSYRSMDSYYEACEHYRRFTKNRGNPYRDSSGKKGPKNRGPYC